MKPSLIWALLLGAGACGGAGDSGSMAAVGLTPVDGRYERALFSPDGKKVAYWTLAEDGWDLWVANADFTEPRELGVRTLLADAPMVWTRDGRGLLVPASDRNQADVVEVPLAGGAVHRLSDAPGLEVPLQAHPDGDHILFGATRPGGGFNTWIASRSTGSVQPALPDEDRAYFASISPDGLRLGIEIVEGNRHTVWVADADGGNRRQLTSEGYEFLTGNPWSPDGTTLLYTSNRTGRGDIWSIPAEGGTARQLTTDVRDDYSPTWSPDGHWVLYRSDRGRQTDVWVVSAEGGNSIRVTDDPVEEEFAQWVGTGLTVSYSAGTSPGSLWSLDLATGAEQRITHDSVDAGDFGISPDGASILHAIDRSGGERDLVILPRQGGTHRPLTSGGYNSRFLWSPDGQTIVFNTNRRDAAHDDIYLIHPGDAEAVPLVAEPGDEFVGGWITDGSAIWYFSDREARDSDIWLVAPTEGATPRRISRSGRVQFGFFGTSSQDYAPGRDILVRLVGETSSATSLEWLAPDGTTRPFFRAAGASYTDAVRPVVSPRGDLVAATVQLVGGGVALGVFAARDGATVTMLSRGANAYAWDRAGNKLLYGVPGAGGLDLVVYDANTKESQRLTTTPATETSAAFDPDGNSIVFRRTLITQQVFTADLTGILAGHGQ